MQYIPTILNLQLNQIALTQKIDLAPFLSEIVIRNCQKQQGSFQIIVSLQVTDRVSGKLPYPSDIIIRLSLPLNPSSSKSQPFINSISPGAFSIFSASSNRTRIELLKQRLVSPKGYLQTFEVQVPSSDYRLPYICNFYQEESILGFGQTPIYTSPGFFKGSKTVECKLPYEFKMLGTIYLQLLINNNFYTNLVPIYSYEAPILNSINPTVLHGGGQIVPIELHFTQNQNKHIPSSIKVKIDDKYSIANLEESESLTFSATTSSKLVQYKQQSTPIQYSFNGNQYYQSDIRLTYDLDLVILDIEPKQIELNTTNIIKLNILHLNSEGKYKCQLNSDTVVEGTVQREFQTLFNVWRTFLFCQVPPQSQEMKILISVLSNNDIYQVQADNFITVYKPQQEVQVQSKHHIRLEALYVNDILILDQNTRSFILEPATSYSLKVTLNATLDYNLDYYCRFNNSEVDMLSPFTIENLALKRYQCLTPIFQLGFQDLSLQLITSASKQDTILAEPIIIMSLERIKLQQYLFLVGPNANQVRVKSESSIGNHLSLLFTQITCLFNESSSSQGYFNYQIQTFTCSMPSNTAYQQLQSAFTLQVKLNFYLAASTATQVIQISNQTLEAPSLANSFLLFGQYITLSDLSLLKFGKQGIQEARCFFQITTNQISESEFDIESSSCTFPSTVNLYLEDSKCYSVLFQVQFRDIYDNHYTFQVGPSPQFCNYQLQIMTVTPKVLYIGDFNKTESQLLVTLNQKHYFETPFMCQVNKRIIPTPAKKINDTTYACRLNLLLKNQLFHIDQVLSEVQISSQIANLSASENLPILLKALPSVSIISPQIINTYLTSWETLHLQVHDFDDLYSAFGLYSLELVIQKERYINFESIPLRGQIEMPLVQSDIQNKSELQIDIYLHLLETYQSFSLNYLSIDILPSLQVVYSSTSYVVNYNSSATIKFEFEHTLLDIINPTQVSLNRPDKSLRCSFQRSSSSSSLRIQCEVSGSQILFNQSYSLTLCFVYQKDPLNLVCNISTGVELVFLPEIDITGYALKQNGKAIQLSLNSFGSSYFPQSTKLKCLLFEQIELTFKTQTNECVLDYLQQIELLALKNSNISLTLFYGTLQVSSLISIPIVKLIPSTSVSPSIIQTSDKLQVNILTYPNYTILSELLLPDISLIGFINELEFEASITEIQYSSNFIARPTIFSALSLTFQVPSDIIYQLFQLSKNKFLISGRLYHSQILFTYPDQHFETNAFEASLFTPYQIIGFHFDSEKLRLVLNDHIDPAILKTLALRLESSDLNVSLGIFDPKYQPSFRTEPREIHLLNFYSVLSSYFNNTQDTYALVVSLYSGQEIATQNSVLLYITLEEIQFKELTVIQQCKRIDQPLIFFNQSQSILNNLNYLSKKASNFKEQSKRTYESKYSNQVLNSSLTFSSEEQVEIETKLYSIEVLQPKTLLFRQEGFKQIIKVTLKTALEEEITSKDSYCLISSDYFSFKSAYVYPFDSESFLCYFEFDNFKFFSLSVSIIYTNLQVVFNEHASTEKVPLALIHDNLAFSIGEVSSLPENQELIFGVRANFSLWFNEGRQNDIQCMLNGLSSNQIVLVNASYGYCIMEFQPMRSRNVSLYILFEGRRLQSFNTIESYQFEFLQDSQNEIKENRLINSTRISSSVQFGLQNSQNPILYNLEQNQKEFQSSQSSISLSTQSSLEVSIQAFSCNKLIFQNESVADYLEEMTSQCQLKDLQFSNISNYTSSGSNQVAYFELPFSINSNFIDISKLNDQMTSQKSWDEISLKENLLRLNSSLQNQDYEAYYEQEIFTLPNQFEDESIFKSRNLSAFHQYNDPNLTFSSNGQTYLFPNSTAHPQNYSLPSWQITEDQCLQVKLIHTINFQKALLQYGSSLTSTNDNLYHKFQQLKSEYNLSQSTCNISYDQFNKIFAQLSQNQFKVNQTELSLERDTLEPEEFVDALPSSFEESSVEANNEYLQSQIEDFTNDYQTLMDLKALKSHADNEQVVSTDPPSMVLSQKFKGNLSVNVLANYFPMYTELPILSSNSTSIQLHCELISASSSLIIFATGKGQQPSNDEFICSFDLTSKSTFYESETQIDDPYYEVVLKIKVIYKQILYSSILDVSGFKIAKVPIITSIISGQALMISAQYAQIHFTMKHFVQGFTFCILGAIQMPVIQNSNGSFTCQMIEQELQAFSKKTSLSLYLGNNIRYGQQLVESPHSNIFDSQMVISFIDTNILNEQVDLSFSSLKLFSGTKTTLQISTSPVINRYYLNFGSLPLKCKFYRTSNLVFPFYETACQFISRQLEIVSVLIKPYSLKKGSYYLQFEFDNYLQSPILSAYEIQVFWNPWILNIYPPTLLFQSGSQSQQIYLIGRKYLQFDSSPQNDGVLRCKLKFKHLSAYYQFIYVQAKVLSENVIQCLSVDTQLALVFNADQFNLVTFTVSLVMDQKEVSLVYHSKEPSFQLLNQALIMSTDTPVLAIQAVLPGTSMFLQVSKSRIFKEQDNEIYSVQFYCIFQEARGQEIIATSSVLSIEEDFRTSMSQIECETPAIASNYAISRAQQIYISINIQRTPIVYTSELANAQFQEQITSNIIPIRLVPQPIVHSIIPEQIFNLARTKQIEVNGENFINGQELICISNSDLQLKATYISPTRVHCPISTFPQLQQAMLISISNDRGKTSSNTGSLELMNALPYLYSLTSPNILFSNCSTDIALNGENLDLVNTFTIQIKLNEYSQIVYCNVSLGSSTVVGCFGVFFPITGAYSVSIVPNQDLSQILKTKLHFFVEEQIVIKSIGVQSGDKLLFASGKYAEVVSSRTLASIIQKYSVPANLFICEGYDDSSALINTLPMTLSSNGIPQCEIQCGLTSGRYLDFRFTFDTYYKPYLFGDPSVNLRFLCDEPAQLMKVIGDTTFYNLPLQNQSIFLSGYYFQQSDKGECHFVNALSELKGQSRSFTKNSSFLYCLLPPLPAETYEIRYSFKDQIYSGSTPLTIQVFDEPIIEAISSASGQMMKTYSPLSISGYYFTNLLQYYCSIKFNNNKQLYYSNAVYISGNQLDWTPTLVNSHYSGECGVLQVKDSLGYLHAGRSPTQIRDTTVCILNDILVDFIEPSSQQFSAVSLNQNLELRLSQSSFTSLFQSPTISSLVSSIALTFSGVATTSCTYSFTSPIILCPIPPNSNTLVPSVKLSLLINNLLSYPLPYLFQYYSPPVTAVFTPETQESMLLASIFGACIDSSWRMLNTTIGSAQSIVIRSKDELDILCRSIQDRKLKMMDEQPYLVNTNFGSLYFFENAPLCSVTSASSAYVIFKNSVGYMCKQTFLATIEGTSYTFEQYLIRKDFIQLQPMYLDIYKYQTAYLLCSDSAFYDYCDQINSNFLTSKVYLNFQNPLAVRSKVEQIQTISVQIYHSVSNTDYLDETLVFDFTQSAYFFNIDLTKLTNLVSQGNYFVRMTEFERSGETFTYQINTFSFTLLDLSAVSITSIDKTKIISGPWTASFTLSVLGMPSLQKVSQKLSCILFKSGSSLKSGQIVSDSLVVQSSLNAVTCYFKKEIVQEGTYCIQLGLYGKSFLLDSCALSIQVYHVPTIYQIQSTQSVATSFLVESEVLGYYLNNWSSSWMCFFFFYQDQMKVPVKIDYTLLPASMLTSNQVLQCSFSIFLEYYSQIKKVEVLGITDLMDYFYEKTIQWKDIMIDQVFISAHLTEISDSFQSDSYIKLYHPGSTIIVKGLFLTYSNSPVKLRLEQSINSAQIYYSSVCAIVSEIQLSCKLPLAVSSYGEYLLSLVETTNLSVVSDDDVIPIVLLPVPNIVSISPTKAYVTTQTFTNATQYKIMVDIQFDTIHDTDLIMEFKGALQERTICRLQNLQEQRVNATWSNGLQLQCEFTNIFDDQNPICVQISLNGGFQFTTGCPGGVLETFRAPLLDSFSPYYGLIRNSYTITVIGQGFISTEVYHCLFRPLSDPISSLKFTIFDQTIPASFLSSTSLSCAVPPSHLNTTHELQVSIYFNGLLAKVFDEVFTFYNYQFISEIYPLRGSNIGGTRITLKINDMFDPVLTGVVLQCRFSFDFIITGSSFVQYQAAQILNSTHVVCISPDVSSQFPAANYYLDIFIAINDFDGVFRPQIQQVFTYLRDYSLTSISPSQGYLTQQQFVQLTGTNIYNVHSLLLKMLLPSTGQIYYFKQDLFVFSDQIVALTLPNGVELNFYNGRTAVFYLSMNDGVDWSSTSVTYTFLEMPHMTKLSKNQQYFGILSKQSQSERKHCDIGVRDQLPQ